MKQLVAKGKADLTVFVFIPDASSTAGAGLTGLVYNTANLVASYIRPGGTRTAITLATQTVNGAHSDGGFVEVDATNMPGLYRLDLPDAVCATGVDAAIVMLKGAANMVPVALELQLLTIDLQAAVVPANATQIASETPANLLGIAATGTLSGTHSSTTADLGANAPANDISGQTLYFPGHKLARVVDSYNTGTGVATFSPSVPVTLANGDAWVLFASAPASTSALPGVDVLNWRGTTAPALVSGRLDVSVGAMQTDVLTAAALAASAVAEIQSGLSTLTEANMRSALGLASANLDTQLGAIDDYLDTEIATIVSNVATILANVATVLAAVDTEVAAIKARTDALPAAPAATGDIPTAVQIADALLGRNIAGGSNGGRTVTSALRRIRNKVEIVAGTLNVYGEDDTTLDHSAAVTTAAGNPITAIDPA